ncbi:MAG TPA: hypothetical protein VEQ59_14590 [Polyangiaceae bacterium]|nr:hypothetical protein [Polyangiaceae bacterium]
MRRLGLGAIGLAWLSLGGCKAKPQNFSTTVEVMQVRLFGGGTGAKLTDLDVKYDQCPGDARQIMRLGKEFAECSSKLKVGDKLKADVVLSWNAERGTFRNEIVHLGACDVKLDPKDEANYQSFENCSDVKATGSVVGVRCERNRSDAVLAACPWLRRN